MEIIDNINEVKPLSGIATIGSFDGVHIGHIALIEQIKNISRQKNCHFTIVTFAVHPKMMFNSEIPPFLLTSSEQRYKLLRDLGVDNCVVISLTPEIASLSARDFMQHLLKDKLGINTLVIGYDHHFGHPKKGECFEDYKRYGLEIGVEVVEASGFRHNGINVSSSKVRHALGEGEMDIVNELLGRNYSISGTVVAGEQIGRTIGFPTANIKLGEPMQMIPADGVYSALVELENNGQFKAVVNIGMRPTVSTSMNRRTIEAHIIGFDGDLYESTISLSFLKKLRDEKGFADINDLKKQIKRDVQMALSL